MIVENIFYAKDYMSTSTYDNSAGLKNLIKAASTCSGIAVIDDQYTVATPLVFSYAVDGSILGQFKLTSSIENSIDRGAGPEITYVGPTTTTSLISFIGCSDNIRIGEDGKGVTINLNQSIKYGITVDCNSSINSNQRGNSSSWNFENVYINGANDSGAGIILTGDIGNSNHRFYRCGGYSGYHKDGVKTVTISNPGSGYTNGTGTYLDVPLYVSGSTISSKIARATINVASGQITNVTITNSGNNYNVGDILVFGTGNNTPTGLKAGSNFSCTVTRKVNVFENDSSDLGNSLPGSTSRGAAGIEINNTNCKNIEIRKCQFFQGAYGVKVIKGLSSVYETNFELNTDVDIYSNLDINVHNCVSKRSNRFMYIPYDLEPSNISVEDSSISSYPWNFAINENILCRLSSTDQDTGLISASTNHGLVVNQEIMFTSNFGEAIAFQKYYVLFDGLTATQFKISSSLGGSSTVMANLTFDDIVNCLAYIPDTFKKSSLSYAPIIFNKYKRLLIKDSILSRTTATNQQVLSKQLMILSLNDNTSPEWIAINSFASTALYDNANEYREIDSFTKNIFKWGASQVAAYNAWSTSSDTIFDGGGSNILSVMETFDSSGANSTFDNTLDGGDTA